MRLFRPVCFWHGLAGLILALSASLPAAAALPVPGTIVSVRGDEGLSRLFSFVIDVDSTSVDADLAGLLGTPANFALGKGRAVHGIITRAEQGGKGPDGVRYRLTLEPREVRLLHRFGSRSFQDKSVPEIVEMVLVDAGIAPTHWRFDFKGTYTKRSFTVQYQESDWNFISRLLEEEGIYTYYEHSARDHVLVLKDRSIEAPVLPGGGLSYAPEGNGEAVSELRYLAALYAGTATVGDYAFERPGADLTVTRSAGHFGDLAVFHFPAGFSDRETGARRADVRLQQAVASGSLGGGRSRSPRLTPGYQFPLSGHYRADLNRDYLVTAVRHRLESGAYTNEFEFLPAGVAFRPSRTAERPVAAGVESATVTGPSNETIHVDAYGRVKVRFHWDRGAARDDFSSAWLRVAQPRAGAGSGAVWLPRVGDEVVVGFEHGDPSRPVVLGSLWNGDRKPPYSLPDTKALSGFRTITVPGGSGYNELVFQDDAGSELVRIHAQKDLQSSVVHDASESIQNDHTITVGHDQATKIGRTATVDATNIVIRATKAITLQVGPQYIRLTPTGIIIKEPSPAPTSKTNIAPQDQAHPVPR